MYKGIGRTVRCREEADIHGQHMMELGWRAGAVEMAGIKHQILEGLLLDKTPPGSLTTAC
jgi:hypothetical protein